jgi:hypothetical protein
MIQKLFFLSLIFFISFLLMDAPQAQAASIVGWVERIHIDDIDASFPAKLDTGAKTSSIDAEVMKLIEPEGKRRYVVFTVKDQDGRPYVLKRKIKRWVRIKKKAEKSGFVRRPVVTMSFCIADRLVEDEVNLADRGDFIYPVLLGRNMLAKTKLAVDAGKTFTIKPICEDSQ